MSGVSVHAMAAAGESPAWLRALALVPRNVCIAILDGYRAAISPLYGDVCRYYPSCSRYTLTAIQEHGVIGGVWLGTRRLIRCHPWARGGVDDVPAARDGHAITGRGGFVLRREPHLHCDHADGVKTETRVNTPNA